jgi:photosystem II stability/assembly factor-like uncharacterized protein
MLLLAGCGSAPAASTGSGASAGPSATTGPSPAPSAQGSASDAGPTQAASPGGAANGAPCRPSAGGPASDFFVRFGRDALTGVQFVSPAQGWVVGQHVILATSNGGATWTTQRRGDLNLTSVDFISPAFGWAVGLNSLLTTADGGRSWTALPEPCGVIRAVHFVSPQLGYAIAGGVNPVFDSALAPAAGGALVVTTNGGHSWQPVQAPADPQSVCFSDSEHGWLGADGRLYESADGGHSWQLRATGDGTATSPSFMFVQCASGSAWALDIGPGAASSQQPHIGYYAQPGTAAGPLFAELYFQSPGSPRLPEAAGAYAGPMSVISTGEATFIDSCAPCGRGYGTVPWLIATAHGGLSRRGDVADLSQAAGASFLTSSVGWVVGGLNNGSAITERIMHTDDGGRSWQVQYRAG